jgi:hypothetical protein
VAVSAPSPTYFVLSPKGVLEVDARGKAVRVVSPSRASAGRRLPGGAEALVYVPEQHELRRLDLNTGTEKVVIRLPERAPTCSQGETIATRELDVQSPSDLLLDPPRAACLTLMDRNLNMASYGLTVYANLTGGPHRVSPSLGSCPEYKGPWCKRDMSVKPGRPAPKRLPGLPEAVVGESTSPSGRWTLVWFVSDSGDYIYLSYYLLDNVLDPNAVIGKDYQLNLFELNDGRVASGVVKEATPAAYRIAMPGGIEQTISVSEVKARTL